ncbi:MAG: type 4a pilus biogenesis protein PilO [Candidatus Omnitrophica bacterium]|nr:type 4a pilus biogenesis protein PilO [Syntrophorhabdaceae bacterium]MDD5353304.1 type 4a pilus biogenesis protein PilO [Candidatus Omnitrophota bacterium]MDD5551415.1 type 4a pilus biogenesis protein PilO [Candidatus Omnitrophota bacterium]
MKIGIDPKTISRKIIKIPKIYKLIVILVLNIVIFGLIFHFIISPQIDTKNKLISEYQALQKDLNRLVTIKNNMDKYRKEYAQMQALLRSMLRQLPETKDIPNLLRNVTNVGEETRLKLKFFEPKKLQNKEFYAELPFEIKFSGPFHNVAYFFDGIRKLERIINITSFSLVGTGPMTKKSIEGACTARAYVYLREPEKASKKENKKDGKSAQPAKK